MAIFRIALAVLLTATFQQLPLSGQETSKPFNGERGQIPGTIEAEHFDLGAADVAYHDVDKKNQGADYREPTGVDIEKRDDASGGHGVGWTRKGEWLIYSVTVKQTGTYTVSMPVASNKKGGTFHLEIEGKDISGEIDVPDTGGWDKLKLIKKENVKLTEGDHRIKVVMDSEGASGSIADIDYFRFELKK